MALSAKAREIFTVAMANKAIAKEFADRADRQAAAVADISTADATDLATAEALANASKAKVNEILAALRAAGLLG